MLHPGNFNGGNWQFYVKVLIFFILHKNKAYGLKTNFRTRQLRDTVQITTDINKGEKMHEVEIALQLTARPVQIIMRSKRVPVMRLKRWKTETGGIWIIC